jgi:hypothetical protein
MAESALPHPASTKVKLHIINVFHTLIEKLCILVLHSIFHACNRYNSEATHN